MNQHAWFWRCVLWIVLLAGSTAPGTRAQTINKAAERLAELTERTLGVARGNVGYKVVNLNSGDVIAARNADHFFTPASNTKLYTTAAALVRLGANYRFETEVRTTGSWTPGQAKIPDLLLVGAGDPNLSGRALPFQTDAKDGDPLGPIEELADRIVAAGIREVDGDVSGVATRYPGDFYPDGWTLDDSMYYYGAPVSALAVNDNSISLTLTASVEGELANLAVKPAFSDLIVNQQVTTDASKQSEIHLSRTPGSNEITLWGTIDSHPGTATWQQDVAVSDAAYFAAQALVWALRERGVVVRGEAKPVYRELNVVDLNQGSSVASKAGGTVLAVHESAPLWQSVQVVNKVSQNLHAEMLLRELGFVTQGAGTLEAGLIGRRAFLGEAGLVNDGSAYALFDGSGLARQNLTTPEATVTLLRYMWQRPERDVWLASLPIGGVDGSLEHRFKKTAGAERVHAKTGSVAHVNALSGYIETKRLGWMAFSIMVNATNGHSAEVVRFLDEFCAVLLK